MQYKCQICNRTSPITPLRYRCDCGSPVLLFKNNIPTHHIDNNILSLWRFQNALPIDANIEKITLGEGLTPIISLNPSQPSGHLLKLDFLNPTGSYKDRGASVLLTFLKSLGVKEVVEDSSGNAGAAIAAYSARAGIRCTIYCPESTSQGKLKQISAYGASLKLIPGNRMSTTKEIQRKAENTCYASHNWNPFFIEGIKTIAFEIAEQMKNQPPSHVICPVGFGSIYLGLFLGFKELLETGIIKKIPRLLGVQPDICCPIYNAYISQTNTISKMQQTAPTLAEGITAELPIRSEMILNAIHQTSGAFTTVDDDDIKLGMKTLAQSGIYVEPTSAVVIQAYEKFKLNGIIQEGDITVSILTGIGLKSGK